MKEREKKIRGINHETRELNPARCYHHPGLGNLTIHPSGIVARVDVNREVLDNLDGIPITYNDHGPVVGLPNPEDGTAYIVSLMVAQYKLEVKINEKTYLR